MKDNGLVDVDKEYYNDIIKLNPLTATFYGDYSQEDKYVGPNTLHYRTELIKLINKYTSTTNTGTLNNQPLYKYSQQSEIMKYSLDMSKEALKYPFYYLPVNHFFNPFRDILDIIDRMQFNKPGSKLSSFESFKKRIFSMIQTLPELCQNILDGCKYGIVENKDVIKLLIKDLEHININMDQITNFKKEYKTFMSLVFIPAAKEMAHWLKKEYLGYCKTDLGLFGFPCDKNIKNIDERLGTKMYNSLLKFHTSTDKIDYKYVFNLGLKLVSELDTKIKNVKEQINKQEKEAEGHKKENKIHYFKTKKEVINVYKKELKQLETDMSSIVDKPKNYKTANIVEIDEEFKPAGLYYPGSLSGSPGTFKVNVRNPKELMYHDVRNLTLHEAMPGHSLQMQYVTNNTSVPKWLRINVYTSVCEGWALYVERFIGISGLKGHREVSLLEQLSTLNSMQIRAVRLIIDVGIHIYGYSFKKCYKIMSRYLYNSRAEKTAEIYRYSAIPGQATSYMIGSNIIEKMYIKSGNNGLEGLKAFHNKFLENSFMPMFMIEKIF